MTEVVLMVSGADLRTACNALYEVVELLEPLMYEITRDASLRGVANIKTEMERAKKLIDDFEPTKWLKKAEFSDNSLDKSLRVLIHILSLYLKNYPTKLEQLCEQRLEKLCEQKILTKITDLPCPLPKPLSFTVGLEKPLEKLRTFIGEPEQSMLVITAPAGCWKTTLATVFCHDQKVKEKFKKNIFFVDVSEKPNLDHIVEQIFLHKGYKYRLPHAIENERCTRSFMVNFLREEQQPVLLVLDGVLCGGEYDKLLEKFNQLKLSTLKILVTSSIHFRRFHSTYDLEWLEDEHAEKLFHYSTKDERSTIPEAVPKDTLKKILKFCKGLPLAITKVRERLCGQGPDVWQNVLTKDSILEYADDVRKILESSLKALDAENNDILKKCFLDLASFPEDRLIPAASLIDMWSHSYYLPDDSHIDNTCIVNLHRLKERTLAELVFPSKDEYTHGYYSEHFVTQHEMLRELAIHQTRLGPIEERERLIMNLCGKDDISKQMSQPMKARLLAISTERVFSTNWQLPDLEVLVLNLQTDKFELPEFMEKLVGKLKVLIVTYYGLLPATAELSNFQLLSSLSNLKRIRLERISIPCIVKNLIKLESVQKISLFMCDISQAFSDSSIKFFEAFPRLEEMNIDYCNGMEQVPTDLCYHTLLKRLSITNCPELLALPEEIGKLENLEELRLVYCTNLLGLPVSIANLTSLKLLDISDCWSMTVLPSGLCSFKELITRRSYKLHFASDT